MPRARRTHAPGCIFHVTARVQGRVRLFKSTKIRRQIAEYICTASLASTTRLLAYAVMPNHLHMVLVQGSEPLGWIVQRVLQRTALLMRTVYGHKDHVFGRRYWSGLIDDASYARQAIIYTHLNPFYAELCKDPADYDATSHNRYIGVKGVAEWNANVCAADGLRFFMNESGTADTTRSDYLRFIRHWMTRPKLPLGAKLLFTEDEISPPPFAAGGDAFWLTDYADAVAAAPPCLRSQPDTRDAAITILRHLAPDVTLDQIRTAGRVKQLGIIRKELIATLYSRGHRNGAIARCLNVSTAHVSAVAAEVRRGWLDMDRSHRNVWNGRS